MEQHTGAALRGLVPMIHVADVDRSASFYRLLGFEIGHRLPPSGAMEWAWLYSTHAANWKTGPNLMLSCSEENVDAGAQQVLFYLYVSGLEALRSALLAHGVEASEIRHPEYLPDGEFQVKDPDGYTLMIAQSAVDTP